MTYLSILRPLVDQQQFAVLKANAQAYLAEAADPCAWPLMALAHAHLGERQQALEAAERAAKQLTELDLDARVDLAGAWCALLHLDEAEELLDTALREVPEHPLALARLAWCRLQQGELDVAHQLYRRSAELAPDRLPVWTALARLSLQSGDTAASQQALDAAVECLQTIHTELAEAAVALATGQLRALQLEIWVAADTLDRAEHWLAERRETLPEGDWAELLNVYAISLAGHARHAAAEAALREGLEHYSGNLVLLSQLAELAQLQGRARQAIQLMRRAIREARAQDQPEVPFWLRLSAACLIQDERRAREAADTALEQVESMRPSETTPAAQIQQLRWQARTAVAQVESQAQQFERAEARFDEVLAENPYFLPALQGLGQQHLQRGHIDDALALFERIKQIDPAKGYAALINARRFPDDVQTLERMEKVARQPSLEGQVRAGLLLQLAAAWEKRRDYDRAMVLANEANEASKRLLNYDPQAHRQRCARIRHAFSRSLYEHRRDGGVDSRLPVFVVGMPRSGTTLVEQILAGHSQICGAGELGVIPQLIAGLERWERRVGSGRGYPDCVDDLDAYACKGLAEKVLAQLREHDSEARHVVDKLPHNFENIGLIKLLFPQARIISVRRDPRDIALSNYFTDYQAKHGGMGFAYDLTWIGEQLADHNLMMHHWQHVFPGEILEVNYEDVVEDLAGEARRMLDYIGVDWEAQVLAFNELDRPVKTASVWQVRQPVYKSSKAKWLHYAEHLAPLTRGTNARIEWQPIEMLALPEAGLLTSGVELYKQGKFDEAEYHFKKLLHHIPEHAAGNFMLGLVYARTGYLSEAVELMQNGHERCPWNPHWRRDLIQAYDMLGETEKAAALRLKKSATESTDVLTTESVENEELE